ncbi:hypothetical protein BC835DRAFT_195020 [Cytidiella melzeri]|nr:hypothetical protein BC835DRAFT_195020 [Cytidiella melzeri]
MKLSTSLVFFITIVTGMLHAAVVAATPFGSTVASTGSHCPQPISSDNPNHLERRTSPDEIPRFADYTKGLSKASKRLLYETSYDDPAFITAWSKKEEQTKTPADKDAYLTYGPVDKALASPLEWAIWDHLRSNQPVLSVVNRKKKTRGKGSGLQQPVGKSGGGGSNVVPGA